MPSKTRRNVLSLLGGSVVVGAIVSAVAYVRSGMISSETPTEQTDSETSEPVPFVIVWNQTSNAQTVTTAVRTAEDETPVLTDTQTIPETEEREYTDLVAETSLTVTAQTATGLDATYQWEAPEPDGMLLVGITDTGIDFDILE